MDSRSAPLRPFVIFCAVVASLGALNNGFNTSSLNIPGDYVKNCPGVASGVVTYYPNSSLPQCIPMDSWIWGVATGLFAVGGLLGAMVSAPLARRMGRRDSMMLMNVTFFIGAILLSTSTTSAQFSIGRIFVGIGAGFYTVVVSLYIAEISPPKYRGALGSMLQLFVTLGILIIECIGLGLSSSIGWRVVTVITVVPAIIQMICLPFLPRSPRWLVTNNRVDEARKEMLRLRNGNIDEEFNDILETLIQGYDRDADTKVSYTHNDTDSANGDMSGSSPSIKGQATAAAPKANDTNLSVLQLMSVPVLAKLTLKMMVVHASGQLTGINAIMYYSTNIFQASFDDSARYVTVGVAGLNVALTVLALGLVDRLGRKMLLLISAVGMCVFSVLMTIGLKYSISPLQVVCIMLFVASYAIGLGVIPFVITAEVYPTYAVGTASSIALVINWLCNFIIGLIFPTLQTACGPYVFLIFAGITFVVAIFVALFVPETKQKSIDQLGHELGWANLDTKELFTNKPKTGN
ncbi:major facilitator superfamily domain-containing protein [Absidia repens]|uniref:Major facilitator superfamily domain-containing protein n=1 Tax=Absidia repens TaxID=90262 RepID=A0A1X2I9I6_9FUNG|nr:major facilitator superfamily domain-containing protein [Absidia repens]